MRGSQPPSEIMGLTKEEVEEEEWEKEEEVGGGCLSVHRGMGGSSPGRRVRGIGGKSVPPPPPHLPTLPDEPDHL